MKSKKNALDTLAEKPTFVLSYDMFGSETWSTKERRSDWLMPQFDRLAWELAWESVQGEFSSDDLILRILKMNPGVELQLLNSNRVKPYFVMYLNGHNVLKLKLPEGVFCSNGYIYTKWEKYGIILCQLETR